VAAIFIPPTYIVAADIQDKMSDTEMLELKDDYNVNV